MKKRLFAALLASLMLLSVLGSAVSADIRYEDEFEAFNDSFWGNIGKFIVEDGNLNGWEDAKIAQSRYEWLPGQEKVSTTADWP